MGVTQVFAGLPVADYAKALPWYERLTGRPADFHPHDTEAVWQLTDTGWIYVVEDAQRAGRALVTFLVDDLDAQVDGLSSRDITPTIETIPGKVRTAAVTDPEGNRITFGQPLNSG